MIRGRSIVVGSWFPLISVNDEKLTEIVKKVFPLKPAEIIAHLDLKKPRYRQTAAYGHFGRNNPLFTWEKTDMVEKLKAYL